MISLRIVLLILALVCFLLAAFEIRPPRLNVVGAGLALWILAELIR